MFSDGPISALTLIVTRITVNHTHIMLERAEVVFRHISFIEYAGLSKFSL